MYSSFLALFYCLLNLFLSVSCLFFSCQRPSLYGSKDTHHWQVFKTKDDGCSLTLRLDSHSIALFLNKKSRLNTRGRQKNEKEGDTEGKSMTVWSLTCQSVVESDRKITLDEKEKKAKKEQNAKRPPFEFTEYSCVWGKKKVLLW